MDIDLLRTFLLVREIGHFGKTAEILKITQSAVSLRVKHLEDQLGAPLFNRYRNNLQLTETGERFVLYAEKILTEWEKAKLDVGLRKQSRKVIRFGATNGFCNILLKTCVAPIYDSISQVMLKVISQDEESLRARLRDKRIDIALLYETLRDTEFHSVPVSSIELVLVSTTPGLTMEKVLEGDYVNVEWGSFFNTRFLELSSRMPNPVLQATESPFALQFILDHGGSAYLPYRLVEKFLGSTLHRVDDAPVLDQPIYAIYAKASGFRADIETIVKVLTEHARPTFSSLDDVVTNFQPVVDTPRLSVA